MKIFEKNALIRLSIIIFVIISLILFYCEFYKQFECYLTGQANIISAEWHIVILNIVLFLLLLIPLSFRRHVNWGEYGIVAAFFVSLFIEMYGFPLTIYFASRYFSEPVQCAESVVNFRFLGVGLGMEISMLYAAFFMAVGTLLIIIGWITLYSNRNKQKFVTTGIYRYSRHPQYLGFILVVFGWLIDWPTLITIVFAPILIYKYIKVCIVEEKEILEKHPEYINYKHKTPLLI